MVQTRNPQSVQASLKEYREILLILALAWAGGDIALRWHPDWNLLKNEEIPGPIVSLIHGLWVVMAGGMLHWIWKWVRAGFSLSSHHLKIDFPVNFFQFSLATRILATITCALFVCGGNLFLIKGVEGEVSRLLTGLLGYVFICCSVLVVYLCWHPVSLFPVLAVYFHHLNFVGIVLFPFLWPILVLQWLLFRYSSQISKKQK